jgi:CheY-like chemotaxis protein
VRTARKRLLLAEDDEINREVALELLGDYPELSIDVAENGALAVERASAGRYDLILMDIEMPVLDGIAATRAIRQLPGHAATPIVAMTANAFAEDKARCLDAGMSDFIAKPVDPDLLFAMLDRWLNGNQPENRDSGVFQRKGAEGGGTQRKSVQAFLCATPFSLRLCVETSLRINPPRPSR